MAKVIEVLVDQDVDLGFLEGVLCILSTLFEFGRPCFVRCVEVRAVS